MTLQDVSHATGTYLVTHWVMTPERHPSIRSGRAYQGSKGRGVHPPACPWVGSRQPLRNIVWYLMTLMLILVASIIYLRSMVGRSKRVRPPPIRKPTRGRKGTKSSRKLIRNTIEVTRLFFRRVNIEVTKGQNGSQFRTSVCLSHLSQP